MEDLVSFGDLVDIKPVRGRFIWSNKRSSSGHITSLLDILLVQISFLESAYSASSMIIMWSTFYYRPIMLQIIEIPNYGPIPFRFNPLWLQNESVIDIITKSWTGWIIGSHVYRF
jgi:hypothetical protein